MENLQHLTKLFVCLVTMTTITALAIHEDATRNSPPPTVACPNTLCQNKPNGNYQHPSNKNYFIQCSNGEPYCQVCWPLTLEFSEKCNQCLYSANDECAKTLPFADSPISTKTSSDCPDQCNMRGPEFSGNLANPFNPRGYISCWLGVTVACLPCPGKLEFNERKNRCLHGGFYEQEPVNL
uniref:Chitin-binding type-2 domain-containing protein n=1 Tax=Clytia hemisphaerica TaxID=252671 RepID=A0A7M5UWH9_9CNID|eukprot:TCONS_00009558-protein